MTALQPIARELVRLSEHQARTPVIVTAKHLSLRPIFLVELCRALAMETDRPVRIEWCRRVPTPWSLIHDRLARFHAQQIQRALRRLARDLRPIDSGPDREWTLQITASIARPGGAHRELVIGWCSDADLLPSWTVPIYLSGESTLAEAAA